MQLPHKTWCTLFTANTCKTGEIIWHKQNAKSSGNLLQ